MIIIIQAQLNSVTVILIIVINRIYYHHGYYLVSKWPIYSNVFK